MRQRNLNFLQMISEEANRAGSNVLLIAAIYDGNLEPGLTLKRVSRVELRFQDSTDRRKVLFHRLFNKSPLAPLTGNRCDRPELLERLAAVRYRCSARLCRAASRIVSVHAGVTRCGACSHPSVQGWFSRDARRARVSRRARAQPLPIYSSNHDG